MAAAVSDPDALRGPSPTVAAPANRAGVPVDGISVAMPDEAVLNSSEHLHYSSPLLG